MKNRILCVILAVLVGIGLFASTAFAFSYFDAYGFLVDILQIYDDYVHDKKANFADTTDGLKLRSHVLLAFNPYRDQLPSDLSKSDFLQLLVDIMGSSDYSYLSEKYGKDVADLWLENEADLLDFKVKVIMPLFNGLEDFVNALYDTDLSGYGTDDNGNVYIPADDLKQELQKQNQTLYPKNPHMTKYSWRELSDGQEDYRSFYLARNIGSNNNQFFEGVSYSDGIYIQPYIFLDYTAVNSSVLSSGNYYSKYQFHIYLDRESGDSFQSSDGGYFPNYTWTWKCEGIYYLVVEGEPLDTYEEELFSFSTSYNNGVYKDPSHSFFYNLGLARDGEINFTAYDKLSVCMLDPSKYTFGQYFPYDCSSGDLIYQFYPGRTSRTPNSFFKSDNLDMGITIRNFFNYSLGKDIMSNGSDNSVILSDFLPKHPDDKISDYGLLVSPEPFTTTYFFDITRIPSNSTITITGDTVYDYTITDNSTGDTTTIYEYVTNNYNYPENKPDNSGSGGSSGGGSMSGDVTVGGKVDVEGNIDVGGKVEVDVNVNVNGGTGGNGGGVIGEMPDMTPVDGFLQDALEESSGIRGFLKEFFSFLPNDIIVILGIVLTAAVFARLLGR